MATDTQEKNDKPNITAYLQAPRKKRKNFVLIATSEKFNPAVVKQLSSYVQQVHTNLAMGFPRNLKELRRMLNRKISLLILDDELANKEELLQMIKVVRQKQRKEAIPILFLTRYPSELIKLYHKHLAAYQELDELCHYPHIETSQIVGLVKVGIEQKNKRKSRRYKVDEPVSFFHLRKDCTSRGRMVDMSLYGCLLKADDGQVFKLGDQLKISIPSDRYVDYSCGEFVRLSARVRRVYISGDLVGVSFEHVSEEQFIQLTKLLTGIVSSQLRS